MRHRKSHRHFSRTSSHRMAMFANMVTSLFKEERIKTTDCKAKELRSVAEKLITMAKHGARLEAEASAATLDADRRRLKAQAIHKRRLAARTLRDPAVLSKLFGEIQHRFA
ncbi:MAG: 50S ribosomal protein L17, partial [Deltaproteobacteria bacterium]|nr:50S ribosomal protein L17 [Deltaproteobacteria bacterium]